ncbi:hypothetical protein [Acetobacter tropicalis]|uniref:Uncharacterized protein n=1 Tax=Acetobacter tropicalis TaxID=104102 RepID=A0A094ZL71_9PROT|nr:hypothetical protein [Acetobacter tropicalis]KGB23136.1 hypothetical protein AtDm6_1784 [Acetobacter tropicalis]MBC9009401.1 hypothetical protein [Acetobacter tropicalis]MDO8172273.1 hypothetical protein [Acetobacter tropicalis]
MKQFRFFATNIGDHPSFSSDNFGALPVHQTRWSLTDVELIASQAALAD